jgi:3-deoxy-manno-octulosonate cytidylyltransferase (CMP-KDO synthetase)
MRVIGIIPARYKSSRFPGKPLADICGKPMIWWVYQQAKKAKEISELLVATDDMRIKEACDTLGMNVLMTSEEHKDCIDRAGEVARNMEADVYVLIQGDEPMLEPEVISSAITPFFHDKDLQATNLMTKITNPVDLVNPTVPKVITNRDGIGVFLTRFAAPFPKGRIDYDFHKQVCVYGFTSSALEFFCKNERGKVEDIEDIGLLRFIENGYRVQFVEVDSETIAVDTPSDLEVVQKIMKRRIDGGELK